MGIVQVFCKYKREEKKIEFQRVSKLKSMSLARLFAIASMNTYKSIEVALVANTL